MRFSKAATESFYQPHQRKEVSETAPHIKDHFVYVNVVHFQSFLTDLDHYSNNNATYRSEDVAEKL